MKPSVLIADGDEVLLYVYTRFLSQRGYQVQTAVSGVDCLDRLRESAVEILILDMEILWGGGDGVLATLRESSDIVSPLAIVVTGDVSISMLKDLSDTAVVRCVQKPYVLTRILDEVLIDMQRLRKHAADLRK